MPIARGHLSVIEGGATPDDATLIAGMRRGDTALANQLVRRAGGRAKASIRRFLRTPTPDDADLTQLVLIELVTTIDNFRGDCSLNTWIDRIAAHVVYKRLRRQRLERRLFDGLGDAAGETVAGSTSTERRALTASVLDRVRHHLKDVDEEKVTAWLLADVHGLSLDEVGHALEISAVAAQSRVSRARREIRACLERDPELLDVLEEWEVRR